jgi:hypothetical protein
VNVIRLSALCSEIVESAGIADRRLDVGHSRIVEGIGAGQGCLRQTLELAVTPTGIR